MVGFQANSTAAKAGYKLYTPTFLEVGKATASTTYTVKPIAITGTVPNGSDSSYRISLQRLKADGGAQGSVLYWKDYDTSETQHVGPGWCTGVGTAIQTVQIQPGEGIMIKYPEGCENCTMQFSGELNQEDAYIALRDGYTLLGNQQPMQLNVNQIVPTSTDPELYPVPNGSDTTTRISIQRLTPTGGTQGSVLFWKDYDKSATSHVGPGWCTGIGTTVQNVMLEPGEAVLVTCHDPNVAQILMKCPAAAVK